MVHLLISWFYITDYLKLLIESSVIRKVYFHRAIFGVQNKNRFYVEFSSMLSLLVRSSDEVSTSVGYFEFPKGYLSVMSSPDRRLYPLLHLKIN